MNLIFYRVLRGAPTRAWHEAAALHVDPDCAASHCRGGSEVIREAYSVDEIMPTRLCRFCEPRGMPERPGYYGQSLLNSGWADAPDSKDRAAWGAWWYNREQLWRSLFNRRRRTSAGRSGPIVWPVVVEEAA